MTPNAGHCLIAGGGQAAAQVAISLRHAGFAGQITVFGDEPIAPYQRPPLSKGYLKGDSGVEKLACRPPALYAKLGVRVRTARRVEVLDRDKRAVEFGDGERIAFDWLVLTTGSYPRPMAATGVELAHPLVLRTLADADRLRALLTRGRRLLVVGAGYLGLEVAAVAVGLAVDVTVLEGAERVLARVAGSEVSHFVTAAHQAAGVKIVTGVCVEQIVAGAGGSSTAVTCTDGSRWEADIVLFAIGVRPDVALAESAGLACENGVLVDNDGRTSDPRIYAAGDCTNHLNAVYGRRMRLESVNNAVEQGKAVASSIAGCPRGHSQMPWFWSDQYQHKLQTVGVLDGHVATTVRGDPARGSFAVLYLDERDGVLAVDAVNAPREFSIARSLLGRHAAGRRLPQPDVWPRVERPPRKTVMT